MSRGFTLIELLAIVAVIGIIVATAVVSLGSRSGSAKIRGATRDIFATIRRARSEALVSGQPTVVTYSTVRIDGEVSARIEVVGAKIFGASATEPVQTLSGGTVQLDDSATEAAPAREEGPLQTRAGSRLHRADEKDSDAESAAKNEGETLEQILFGPIADDVVRGVCLKVTLGEEALEYDETEEKTKTKISVFSNVDYLIDRYRESAGKQSGEAAAETSGEQSEQPDSSSTVSGEDDLQPPVSIGWEVNGQVKPHRLWIYLEGSSPESGLSIKIDRFGAAKVLSPGEDG